MAHKALQQSGCQRAGRLLLQGMLDESGHQLQAAAVAVALSAPTSIRSSAVGDCLKLDNAGLYLLVGLDMAHQVSASAAPATWQGGN